MSNKFSSKLKLSKYFLQFILLIFAGAFNDFPKDKRSVNQMLKTSTSVPLSLISQSKFI